VAHNAESLPLRRDMVTLLEFVRDNKVVGTQSTGNMPLKAVRAVTERFVNPPQLEATIGDQTYRIRSEEQLWPLYFLHILAEVGGLIKTGRVRRWRLTAQGERFLDSEPLLQVPFLAAVWWYRINWLVAYSLQGMGDRLPYGFPEATLASLQALPAETDIPFDEFADDLIQATGLTWTARDSSFAQMALRGSIHRMVVHVLENFGMLKTHYRKKAIGKGTVPTIAAFRVTDWGAALLDALSVLGS
jgi:hypothetical protein